MTSEFSRYKQVVEQHTKQLKPTISALKAKDSLLKEVKIKSKALLHELACSVDNQLEILRGRKSIKGESVSPCADSRNRPISPFEQRLLSYQH